jgi:hypothetical protein
MSLIAFIAGLSGGSSGESGGTQLSAPVLFISSQSAGDLVMDWNDVSNNSGYEIQMDDNNSFTSPSASTVSPSTKSYTGLPDGTIYLRVRTLGNETTYLTSDWSNVITTTITDTPFDLSSATHKVVRTGGTVGVNCDYTTITAALAAITTASVSNQFVLDVKNGTYNETGTFDGAYSLYVGITLKDYVHIIGESKTGVIIYGPETTTPANEVLMDVFHTPATCLVQNVTVRGYKNKYCFHADYNSGGYQYSLYIKDCVLEKTTSASGFWHEIGCGIYGGQKVTVINTTMSNHGFYAHGNASATRDLSKHFEILLSGCTCNFEWTDYIEYAANKITLTNNTIDNLILTTSTGVYDANPGNPACNTGTKVYTPFTNSGNTVTTVTRDTETAAILGTTMDTPSDFV